MLNVQLSGHRDKFDASSCRGFAKYINFSKYLSVKCSFEESFPFFWLNTISKLCHRFYITHCMGLFFVVIFLLNVHFVNIVVLTQPISFSLLSFANTFLFDEHCVICMIMYQNAKSFFIIVYVFKCFHDVLPHTTREKKS